MITSVQAQLGEPARVAAWVAESYQEICRDERFSWGFVMNEAQVMLVPGQGAYTGAEFGLTDLVAWDTTTFRVAANIDLSDEQWVAEARDWQTFRDTWLFSTQRQILSLPLECAVDDRLRINFGPKPDRPYTAVFEYTAATPPLGGDDDVPIIPPRFHMAIVWLALRHYGMYESAAEVVARADLHYNRIMLTLIEDQADQAMIGPALC
jgi:hypothetical protein